ncbi:hypothetical protein L207DRAFT_583416 [Hyaloscypha variabilis F]|uniref:Uncharacterized protein n=1 Tax=Hyaloscypha variabilis (strain UAMH 11265 / GT02V1 / F) TaxID=1149755 RepID=A0A2J6RM03_HYAVF|nr:hypothetical protein L207DRAFT_583416 [Hyaloscypha variabilis F]
MEGVLDVSVGGSGRLQLQLSDWAAAKVPCIDATICTASRGTLSKVPRVRQLWLAAWLLGDGSHCHACTLWSTNAALRICSHLRATSQLRERVLKAYGQMTITGQAASPTPQSTASSSEPIVYNSSDSILGGDIAAIVVCILGILFVLSYSAFPGEESRDRKEIVEIGDYKEIQEIRDRKEIEVIGDCKEKEDCQEQQEQRGHETE